MHGYTFVTDNQYVIYVCRILVDPPVIKLPVTVPVTGGKILTNTQILDTNMNSSSINDF